MAKIKLDKYYTPIEVANHCWEKVNEIIGLNNIDFIIEPSCGNGSFCHYKRKPDLLIDIEPEVENAIKQDFLKYNLSYKKNSLVIGNPPYGSRLKGAQDFYNKSCTIADYIAFILPITQLNNSSSLYRFDLIYSEDLGFDKYSNRNLHCCFNIYKRPETGMLNEYKKETFNGIKIYRKDGCDYNRITDYDIRMCCWGTGVVGKILTNTDENYALEYKIKIDDNHPQKKEIIKIINTTNWNELALNIASKVLKKYVIINELKKHGIKELKDKNSLF